MKKELLLATVTAIIGATVGFLIINIFASSIEPFTITTLYPSNGATTEEEDYGALSEPNPEIFNYKSINPTVEVYVGDGSSTTIVPEESTNTDNSPETPEEEQ